MSGPNVRDQRLQSVLRLLDIDTGNIDGIRGSKTNAAIEKAAVKLGMAGQDPKDVQQALLDKLKQPLFLAAAAEKLKQIDHPTKNDVIAMQTILSAAGHDDRQMRVSSNSKLMNGELNDATQFALAHTRNGAPDYQAYIKIGIPEATAQAAVAENDKKFLTNNFQGAVAGISPANPSPTLEGARLATAKPAVVALIP
ncbi:MAG: hypothetical protein A3B66_01245 [Alphaproteobacteria bacterium RIFCSPHIGHO2_02_FULL_46_13]|nr:MAG: hypothetical protein A3B66_01245 [Alphaproteobacteria bacterium RIFCSPHIGHO2_02_FULL_46_13]